MREGRELAKWVAVTLVAILAVYVGWYYAMVRPSCVEHWDFGDDIFQPPTSVTFAPHYSTEDYRRDEEWFIPFFSPIHWLDRHAVRPHVWRGKPGEPE